MVLQAITSPDFEWVRQASEGSPVPRFGSGQAPPRREESTPPVKHRLSTRLIFEFGNSASSQRVMSRTRAQGQDLFRKDPSEQQQEESAPAAKGEESSPEEEDRKPAARESPRFSLSYSEDEHEHDIGVPQPAVAVLETDGIGVVQAGEAEDYLAAHPGYHHGWNEGAFEGPDVPPAYAAPTSAPQAHGQPPLYFDPSIYHPEVAAAIHTIGAQQQQQQMIAGQGDYHGGGYGHGSGYYAAAAASAAMNTGTDVPVASHAFRPPAQAKPPPPVRAKRKTTKRGKKITKFPRIEPSDREKAEATTGRAKKALKIWYDRLNELARYKAVHGHTNVPQKDPENPQLGIWVNKQRMEKKFMDDGKQSSMTQDRMNALERLGFAWAKRKGDFAWFERFEELQEFKVQHGHVNVPTKYDANKALGRWVSTQRSQAKLFLQGQRCHMTQDRYDRLLSIGFNFDMSNKKEETSDQEVV